MLHYKAKVGGSSTIYAPDLSNIGECEIGEGCTIHCPVWIGNDVKIGDNVKIQAFSFIPDGVTIENGVFIGPHVCFTNDKYPPSGGKHWARTLIKEFAVIGAGSVILPGVTIGVSAVVGAGALVTKDVEDHAIVFNDSHAVRKGTKK